MTLDYQKVWETMNSLESTICKAISVRQVIDAAVEALEHGDREKAENLMNASYDFIGYFVDDFDKHFKDAWNETVVKLKQGDSDAWDAVMKEKEYYEPTMPPWGHSDMEYLSQYSGSNVSSFNKDDSSPECKNSWNNFWEENYYPEEYKTHSEMVEAGYEMTADGFWIPPQKEDKVVKWRLPVEVDGPSGEYFIQFPDDLLEAANLKEGDKLNWKDNGDGTYTLTKHTEPLESDEC